jgi:hypothetical protein
MNHLRGTDVNNIFVVNDFGYINYFNGNTWQRYFILGKRVMGNG